MIGLYVARFTDSDDPKRLTRYHFVESEIAERKVTHCGRQLGHIEGTVMAPVVTPPPGQGCERCKPTDTL